MRNQPPDGFYELVAALVAADKKRGLSVEAIADGMGINRSRLYRYLGSGRTDGPSGSTLAAMADYWGMTMDDLWHGRRPVTGADAAAAALEVLEARSADGPRPAGTERRRYSRRATDPPPP